MTTQIQSPEPWPYVLNRRETFEILPPQKGCILFIGDSITQRNEWSEMFHNPRILNRGIDSDRITWLIERLDNLMTNEPSKIFIKIGINDIMDGKRATQMSAEYRTVLNRFKALKDCEVYLQSCLPVNHSTYAHPIQNEDVQAFNQALALLAEEYGFKFINLYPLFVTEANELDAALTRDGVHLNGAGYSIWRDHIEPLVNS